MVLIRCDRGKLDGDAPAQARILGQINSTHPALAKLVENAIMRDDFPDHDEPEFLSTPKGSMKKWEIARAAHWNGGLDIRNEVLTVAHTTPKPKTFQGENACAFSSTLHDLQARRVNTAGFPRFSPPSARQ